jgi:hypothetical protein
MRFVGVSGMMMMMMNHQHTFKHRKAYTLLFQEEKKAAKEYAEKLREYLKQQDPIDKQIEKYKRKV